MKAVESVRKKLKYTFHSGKNWNLFFFINSYAMHVVPRWLYNLLQPVRMKCLMRGKDMEYLNDRVDYYCKLKEKTALPTDAETLGTLKMTPQSAYYHDFFRTQRWYKKDGRCVLLSGDITYVPAVPSIVKSRPIAGSNENSVVLKLDRTRHFVFLRDNIPFEKKLDKVIFRGGCSQRQRVLFMQKFFNHDLVDAAEVTKHPTVNPPEWRQKPMTLYDHFNYKFIMSIEGNDVASNLKWIMASNSVAVMPRPTYETWFMEGRLIPDYHYIEVKPDYSDLEEKIHYYIDHPSKVKEIIAHAHEYVAPFRDKRTEALLETLVFEKYLTLTK